MPSAVVIGTGKMGKLIEQTLIAHGFEVLGAFGHENINQLNTVEQTPDVVVDFSGVAAFEAVVGFVREHGCVLVSGTTGFSPEQLSELKQLGESVPVIHAANYSVGVAVLRRAVAMAAEALNGWDTEIVETHHNQKVDAPSGTAKLLLAAIDPEGTRPVVSGREGFCGARTKDEIGVFALRGGTVAGTHEVHFFGQDEEVCLTHRATSRQIFVNGAVACAEKLLTKAPGFYTFEELIFG